MKHVDKLWEGKIKPGFEMLVNNFSAGIASALLAVIGFFVSMKYRYNAHMEQLEAERAARAGRGRAA